MKGSSLFRVWARTCLLTVLLALGTWLPPVQAESPLRVELDPLSPIVHPGRVMPTLWNFQGRGTAVYRGQLQFTLRFEQQKLSTVFIDDVAIAGPQQQLRLILPPVPAFEYIDQIEVDLQLVAEDQTYELGSHVLRVPSLLQNVSTVAVLESRLSGMRSREHMARMNQLSLDRFYGQQENPPYTSVFLSTNPQDAAPDPYWWCGFDAVCLFPNGFRELRTPQLESLLPWVRAGGRLYVEANDSTTSPQYAWINSLLESGGQPKLIFDTAGELLSADAFTNGPVCLTLGLGKVLIQLTEQPSTASEIPLHLVGAFWNLPQVEASKTLANSDPIARFQAATQQHQPQAPALIYHQTLTANMEAAIATQGLIEWLLPGEIRLVPLSYLSLLLGGLIIAIGPCEWFLLGKLRRRKWTWFTFPAAVLLTTGTTLALSDYYMASTDNRHALLIHDLGADGQLARTYRLELLFPRSSGTYTTTTEHAIVAPIRAEETIANGFPHMNYPIRVGSRYVPPNQVASHLAGIPHYEGRPPGDYVLKQALKQWSPQLNGEFSLPDPENPVKNGPLSWSSAEGITRSQLENLPRDQVSTRLPTALIQEVQQHFGANAAAAILTTSRSLLVDDNSVWFNSTQQTGQNPLAYHLGKDFLPSWLSLIPYSTLRHGPSFWGPGIADTLQGLPLLAADDPDHWVLLILVPDGPNWHLYRQVHQFSKETKS